MSTPAFVTAAGLVSAACQRFPEREAVRDRGRNLTYGALWSASTRLAYRLAQAGAGPGVMVGLASERGVPALLGLLATLRTGAVLVPLDPSQPHAVVRQVIDRAGLRLVVGTGKPLRRLAEDHPDLRWLDVEAEGGPPPPERALPELPRDAPAYVLFTSGSTGRPKGVVIPHGALASSLSDGIQAIDMRAGDRCAQLAPLTFDAAVWEHLAPLVSGATLVPVASEALSSPDGLRRVMAEEQISWTYLPPALFAQWVAALGRGEAFRRDLARDLASVRCILFAGETLAPALVRAWQDAFDARMTLMNFYGPTETTVLCCGYRIQGLLPAEAGVIPIGKPFGDNRIRLLDEELRPVRPGQVATIYIGGPQLALGYLGEPELTGKAFVDDPELRGQRLYDSGDLGYLGPGGELVFAGRRDRQVKVRGKRIELEAVEAALRAHPAIREVCAFAIDEPEGKRLCAFAAGEVEAGALRAHAAERLPDYAVPGLLEVLERLPVTERGKVDQAALEARARARREAARAAPAERDPIRAVWRQVLGHAELAEGTSFYAAGGDSLRLFRALVLAQELGYEVEDVKALLAENTLEGWHRHLKPARPRALPPGERGGEYAVGPMQEEMFVLAGGHPGRNLFHIQFAFDAQPFDEEVLERAFQGLIRLHPILRTTFARTPRGLRSVESPPEVADAFRLERVELGGYEGALRAWLEREHARPFDPARLWLVRAASVRTPVGRHLALSFFHPVLDGWSFSLLVLQLSQAYRALAEGHAAPTAPAGTFRDYVGFLDPLRSAAPGAWAEALREPLPLVDLPRPLPAGALERRAFHVESDPATAERMEKAARARGVTLHKLLLTSYFRLFHRLTRQREMLIGNTVAGRPWELPMADRILGCFVSILPVRVPDSGKDREALLEDVSRAMDEAAGRGPPPVEHHSLLALGDRRRAGESWKVIFALDNFPEDFQGGLFHWPPRSWNAIEPYDIALSVIHLRGRFFHYWNYRSDAYPEVAIRELAALYGQELESWR